MPSRVYALLSMLVFLLPVTAGSKKPTVEDLIFACDHWKTAKDCRELSKIAEKDKDLKTKLTAIRGVKDEALLLRIADRDADASARKAAADRLQEVYLSRATGDGPLADRLAALDKLTDPPGYLKNVVLRGGAKNNEVRIAAVRKVADQDFLANVAAERDLKSSRLSSMGWDDVPDPVRREAFQRLSDESQFFRLAKEFILQSVDAPKPWQVPQSPNLSDSQKEKVAHFQTSRAFLLESVKRLQKPENLLAIAKSTSGDEVASIALAQIDDQSVLADVAISAKASAGRRAAVERLTNPSLLLAVAKSGGEGDAAIAACKKLTDQAALLEVAAKGLSPTARLAAVAGMSDPKLLLDLANTSDDWNVGMAAVAKLTDESSLLAVALHATPWGVRSNAVYRLTNPESLYLAARDSPDHVGTSAYIKITDPAKQRDLARSAKSPDVRARAVESVEDRKTLLDIALKDAAAPVRLAAVQKLVGNLDLIRLLTTAADGKTKLDLTGNADLLKIIAAESDEAIKKAASAGLMFSKTIPEPVLWMRADVLNIDRTFTEYLSVYPAGPHAAEAKAVLDYPDVLEGALAMTMVFAPLGGGGGPAGMSIRANGRDYDLKLTPRSIVPPMWNLGKLSVVNFYAKYRVRGKVSGNTIVVREVMQIPSE